VKTTTAILLALPLSACDPAAGGRSSSNGEPSYAEPPASLDDDEPFSPPRGSASSGTASRIADAGSMSPVVSSTSFPARLDVLRTAAAPPPPISGGTLAVSADGQRVVAADPDRDAVYVVDMAALRVEKVSLATGSEPGRVALDDAGGAHVALRGSGKLVRIDLATARVARESALCEHPRGLAFDRKNQALLASCMDGQLVTLDPVTHHEQARLALPHDLRDVVVNAAGQRSVARYRSAELLNLQAGDGVRTSRPSKVKTLPGFSASTDASEASPALAWRALASPSGSTWMLHQRSQDGEVAVGRGGYYGSGCQAISTGAITEFDSEGVQLRSMPIALQGLSVDLALSPNEKWLALASPGAFVGSKPTLQVYAATSMQAQASTPSCSNVSPTATAGLESQTVAVAFGADGLLYALSREPAQLTVYRLDQQAAMAIARTATLSLDSGSVRDTGHDLFHADVGRGLACASCHGEALDDGHVWNFQKIGPRRTQNIRGGLLDTAPFHWDGDMPSVGHLVDDVMVGRMGGFTIDSTFSSALGQWMHQQPALSLPSADAAAVGRGQLLFESDEAACGSCHSGPALTNNESADVGTGGSFQVPGLLGLGLRAPYMHNGCAATLRERFTPACGGDKHGNTAQLSEAQLTDLVAYLGSL
jgi:mono/diheme cytochrome c family protein